MDKKKIVIVVMSADQLRDFAGPTDVFVQANKNRDLYDVELASAVDGPITGAGGIHINCVKVMEFQGNIDTLLITGHDTQSHYDKFYAWLDNVFIIHTHLFGRFAAKHDVKF